ncbi:geranylgeranylglyceryl phosphate synthase [Bacillus subtilis]|nr:geranylgeranylglyceryl phosphate synthase [Bacillus subtilis]
MAEGYCIANPDCKAAALTEADADLNMDDIVAYARVSELLQLPIFLFRIQRRAWRHRSCQKTKAVLETSTLFYGGGIKDAETAKQYAEHADVIVVGNAVYEDFDRALKTVAAVKGE